MLWIRTCLDEEVVLDLSRPSHCIELRPGDGEVCVAPPGELGDLEAPRVFLSIEGGVFCRCSMLMEFRGELAGLPKGGVGERANLLSLADGGGRFEVSSTRFGVESDSMKI